MICISGTAGDSFDVHRGMSFTTIDQDNDTSGHNCARIRKGAWWYRACHNSNLNGLYSHGSVYQCEGIVWKHWKNNCISLKRSEMKIRPNNF